MKALLLRIAAVVALLGMGSPFSPGEAECVYFPEWEGLGFEERKREWFGPGEGCEFGMKFLWLER